MLLLGVEEFGVPLPGVEEFGVPLLGVDVCPDPAPVDVEGVVVGLLVDGDAVLGGVDWAVFWFGVVVLGFWLGVGVRVPPDESVVLRGVVLPPGVVVPGLLRGGVRSPGVVPGVFRGVLPSLGVAFPGRWVGIRPSGVLDVRPSAVPGVRPSGVGVGVLRGVVGDVALGVDAGPVPVVDGVPAEGFLAGPEPGFGLVADVLPPEAPVLWCPPGAAPPVEGAVGDVGMAEPPLSERPPVLEGDGSAVDVGAALDCVGAVAARLSILVPIEPPPGEDDVPPDDVGVGADWTLGDDRPDTGEPAPECEGPDVLGVLDEPLESEPLDAGPPEEGSSKSDRDGPEDGVGLEYGVSEEDGFPESEPDPESEPGPAPMLGAPMSLPPVSAEMPLPMFVPGMLPSPVRVEVEESDPDAFESEDDELEEEESEEEEPEEEESEDEESEDEELELPAPESLPESLPVSLPGNPDSDAPSYPSIRLSIAFRARLPAFWPRLSRTPSAKVCGLCLRASRPAVPPALRVAPTS
ncbi:hypothetical protein [Streptomyces sp. NBC_01092]|uniref:hypothetical protein n=1 Tax=Streptomyces sp. NBC_01092 TaxID=2903748 RepID=UPI00386E98B6|nr:hypothetical protein OG254_35060 [Streptomyces sp. NBC_01092]